MKQQLIIREKYDMRWFFTDFKIYLTFKLTNKISLDKMSTESKINIIKMPGSGFDIKTD